jgi:hypothetical protein
VNEQDLTKEIARREALAAAWRDSAGQLRQELEQRALAEHQRHGGGFTLNFRDLGKVVLPVTTEAPVIADAEPLVKWVKARYPENVETAEQVRPAFQKWLVENATVVDVGHPDDNRVAVDRVVVDPQTGEVIPGMKVREGGQPRALTITVNRDAKALYASWAAAEVDRALADEYGQPAAASTPEAPDAA